MTFKCAISRQIWEESWFSVGRGGRQTGPGNYAKSRHGKGNPCQWQWQWARYTPEEGGRRTHRRRKESWRKVDAPNELNLFGMDVPSSGWTDGWVDGQPMAGSPLK